MIASPEIVFYLVMLSGKKNTCQESPELPIRKNVGLCHSRYKLVIRLCHGLSEQTKGQSFFRRSSSLLGTCW